MNDNNCPVSRRKILKTAGGAAVAGGVLSGTATAQTTHTVPGDHSTIQDAVNAASAGDTVSIKDGTYEETVEIGREITLVGESRDGTVISSPDSSSGPVITISPNVDEAAGGDPSITDENWYRSGAAGQPPGADQHRVENVTVRNLTVTDANGGMGRGIYTNYSDGVLIQNVHSHDNEDKGFGNGYNKNLTLENLDIHDNGDDGITFFYTHKSEVRAVTAYDNDDDGVDLHGNGNTIENVEAYDNAVAGVVMQAVDDNNDDYNGLEGEISETDSHDNGGAASTDDDDPFGLRIEVPDSAPTTVSVTGSSMYSNQSDDDDPEAVGVSVSAPSDATVSVNQSDIYDNEGVGMAVVGGVTVDATDNWWGHASGPGGSDGRRNPAGKEVGKGDEINHDQNSEVEFDPWLRRSDDNPSR